MAKPLIIYGPAGCGKTRNAGYIGKAFNATAIVDMEFIPAREELRKDHIYLVQPQTLHSWLSYEPDGLIDINIMDFESAMERTQ